jgi:hypothetical protein
MQRKENRRNSINIQSSIDNIQSLQDSKNIPIQFFATKCTKITTKILNEGKIYGGV